MLDSLVLLLGLGALWGGLFLVSRRFERKRRREGSWNEDGPIDPTFAPPNPALKGAAMDVPAVPDIAQGRSYGRTTVKRTVLTFGTTSLFTAETSLAERAPLGGVSIGTYIKSWDVPLQAAYANLEANGERALVVTLAPGGRHAIWLVSFDNSDVSAEVAAVQPYRQRVSAPGDLVGPILLAICFFAGRAPVSPATVGAKWPPLPEELRNIANSIAVDGGVSIDGLVDAYWSNT